MHFTAPAALRLRHVHMACTSGRLELFTGPLAEYRHAMHGINVMAAIDDMVGYEFDLPLAGQDVQQATLKVRSTPPLPIPIPPLQSPLPVQFFPVLNRVQQTFDIFEIELHLSTADAASRSRAAAATTSSINMHNVQQMLAAPSARPLSAPAERLRQFLAAGQTGLAAGGARLAIGELMAGLMAASQPTQPEPNNEGAVPPVAASPTATPSPLPANVSALGALLQAQLAAQLQQLERRLIDRLAATEHRLEAKLDRIVALLEGGQTVDGVRLD